MSKQSEAKTKQGSDYESMLYDFRKWTFKQFYPGLMERLA